jgi:hypothetical protein
VRYMPWVQARTIWAIKRLDQDRVPEYPNTRFPDEFPQTYYETVEATGFDPLAGRHENCWRYNAEPCEHDRQACIAARQRQGGKWQNS